MTATLKSIVSAGKLGGLLRDCVDGEILRVVGTDVATKGPGAPEDVYVVVNAETGGREGWVPVWACHEAAAAHLTPEQFTDGLLLICYEWGRAEDRDGEEMTFPGGRSVIEVLTDLYVGRGHSDECADDLAHGRDGSDPSCERCAENREAPQAPKPPPEGRET